MIHLVSSGWKPLLASAGDHPHIGRLVHPGCCDRVAETASSGMPYAVDNEAFVGFDPGKFRKLLDKLAPLSPAPLWVAVPDVVADAVATRARFDEWLPELTSRGLRAAYVLQDGQEHVPVPWDQIACVFVGGTDDFKLGPIAAELTREAKARGLWVHVGRVNTAKRARYINSLHVCADSFDGTKFSRFRNRYLRDGLAWAAAPSQIPLFTI